LLFQEIVRESFTQTVKVSIFCRGIPKTDNEDLNKRMEEIEVAMVTAVTKLREADAGLRLRASVIGRAVVDGWEVADVFESLKNGEAEDPSIEKARKLAAEKRKMPSKEAKTKRARGPEQADRREMFRSQPHISQQYYPQQSMMWQVQPQLQVGFQVVS
jgi:hypothetical protein